MRYPKETNSYYFYHPEEQKIFVAHTGVILKREFILRGVSGRKIELDEVLILKNALDFEWDDMPPKVVEHHEEVVPHGSEQSEPPPVL